jgi:hypothetical protein
MWSYLNARPPRTVFDAYNDTVTALNKARTQKIANALSQIKLNYAPQMAQQGADLGAANVAIKQSDAQYEPQMNAADLAGKNLQNHQRQLQNMMASEKFKYLPQQIQQGIALQNAKLAQVNQMIKLAPQKLALLQQRFGSNSPSTIFRNYGHLTAAAKNAIAAHNAGAISNVMQSGFNQAANAAGAPVQSAPLPQQGMPSAPPPDIAATQSGAPDNTPMPAPSPSPAPAPQLSPAAQSLQFASQVASNKGSVSAYSTKRLDNSIEIEKFLQDPEVDTDMAALSKYAGIVGKGKAFIQAWQKENPEEFERYLTAKNQLKSTLVNLQKNLEGLSVHVSQRKELIDNLMQGFNAPSSNPERAWDQWQRTKQILHNVAKSNSIAAQPNFPGVREKQAGLSYDNTEDLNKMVDVKVNGRRASIPMKNLEKALQRPGITMDLGD